MKHVHQEGWIGAAKHASAVHELEQPGTDPILHTFKGLIIGIGLSLVLWGFAFLVWWVVTA